jgi:O-antigen ligase
VDHAHNDYAEFLVEYGPVGLAAFIVVLGGALARTWRLRNTAGDAAPYIAAAAGLAGLAALAIVDFPLHRPAEWALFWLLLGTAYSAAFRPAGRFSSTSGSQTHVE